MGILGIQLYSIKITTLLVVNALLDCFEFNALK